MKNLLKKVMMVLTCFIIFMTNVNVVGVIKNIDVSGLFRKVEDRSNVTKATDVHTHATNICVYEGKNKNQLLAKATYKYSLENGYDRSYGILRNSRWSIYKNSRRKRA